MLTSRTLLTSAYLSPAFSVIPSVSSSPVRVIVSLLLHVCLHPRPVGRIKTKDRTYTVRTAKMRNPDPVQDLVDALRRMLTSTFTPAPPATTSAFTAASPSPSMVASPMAKPAPFTGSEEDCNGFLLQCSLFLEMQPHLYPDDRTKVAFIISQLHGKALRWAEPLWTQKNPVVKSLSSFINHFKEVFGKPAWDSSIEHQGQPLFPSVLRQPGSVSHPEPDNEPMQIENSRLLSAERQRRLTQNLCLYCGHAWHYISECPTRPGRPMVSVIMPMLNKMKPLTIVVHLTAANFCLPANALLNSGSTGNFISRALCRQLQLKTTATPKIYQIHSVTGKPLCQKR
ncbi:hypothetical protein QTP70_014160 [Hemibagrus guttatus]|uniref:DUF4939 domain-containing protein n=1 Tax=Hemibagrus guttatus TaxID=175788 RepID=A0AAE0UY86_9TELE|nr:hypothetical protein QTP70_014160 [Hemibagrus guttatus]